MVAYIYALSDPRTCEVRYIGKTVNINKRLRSHLKDSLRRNTPVYAWIRKLASLNLVPLISLITECSIDDWRQIEKDTIRRYRETHKLLNLADGGDMPYCSYETRAANGKLSSIARVSTPRKKRLYFLKQQLSLGLKRGTVSEKTKCKLRYLGNKYPNIYGDWANV